MQRYISFIKQYHSTDTNAGDVLQLLQCLEHVELDIDRFAEHAAELGEYPDVDTAKRCLFILIQDTKYCFDELIRYNHPSITRKVLERFRPLSKHGIEQSFKPALDCFGILWQPDYYLKSVRADERCFVREFIASVTQGPGKEEKFSLRPGERKPYTVKGTGVIERASRTPQYTLEEKRYHSQHQSISLVFGLYHPTLFDHGKARQETSVAFMLHNALPNRYLVYDGGTVKRPFDFVDPVKAKKYYDKKVLGQTTKGAVDPVLFADKEGFKQALIQKQHRGKYNEVLARIRWDKTRDKVVIGNDTFSSRCMAQDYARLMREALKAQSAASGEAWDDTYEVPICYYLPGQDKHLQPYTQEEQAKDRAEAFAIFRDKKRREEKYKKNEFEFLLCLNDQRDVHAALQDHPLLEQPLLLRILASGKVHIALSLLEKADPAMLEQIQFDNKWYRNATFSADVIYQIVRTNNPYLWKWLKASDVDVSTKNADGNTALHLAAINNTVTAMKLVVLGADVDQVDKQNCTPLFIAAANGHLAIVAALLAAGADKDKATNTGTTPLFIAAQQGHVAIVTALLAAGADKDKARHTGVTPLFIAAQEGHVAIVTALLAVRADKDKAWNGVTPLYMAAQNGHVAIVTALLAAGADKDKARNNVETPLFIAAQKGHVAIVAALLAAGADKDKAWDGATPLYIAAYQGHAAIVAALLAAGADISKTYNGTTPLHIAKSKGHTQVIAALSKHAFHQFKDKGLSHEEAKKALSWFGLFAPTEQAIAEKILRAKQAAQAVEDVLNGANSDCLKDYKDEINQIGALNDMASQFKF